MSINQDILQLSKRIAVSHDWAAAKAFKAYVMHDDERAIISRAAVEILALLPSSVAPECIVERIFGGQPWTQDVGADPCG
jgi:hypothetical protein